MEKFFNTAGPVNKSKYYKIDPLQRFDLEEILVLIRQEKYFVLHAPRQTGKTSCLLALRDYLNEKGDYYALYINVEAGQAKRGDEIAVVKTVLSCIVREANILFRDETINEIYNDIFKTNNFSQAVNEMLSRWCSTLNKPLILLIDEIDSLVGDSLISILRQIRSGYPNRPKMFPQSMILCGLRDVRDYRINTAGQEVITGGSPFNIKATSLRLGNFSREDIKNLYLQHTAETGQHFEDECFELAWRYTEGQPWLVNALAHEVTFNMKHNRNRDVVITADMFVQAKENIILRRETHIDQLADKLKEKRVHSVIAPILSSESSGENVAQTLDPDDIQYCIDLGLIVDSRGGKIRIANEIYKEVIPRELTWGTQRALNFESLWYINEDGTMNVVKLMEEFQRYFRRNSEFWTEMYEYKEAGPHLLLMAFLQRVLNGGGSIHREYAAGRGRMDLLMEKTYGNHQKQEVVLEVKILNFNKEETINKGMEQISEYMDTFGVTEGHFVMIDRRKDISWEEKIMYEMRQISNKTIHIWGM